MCVVYVVQVPQWQVAQENTHGKLNVARCEVPPVDYKHTDEHMTEWNIQCAHTVYPV